MRGPRGRRTIRRLIASAAVLGISVGSTELTIPSASAASGTGGARVWVERYDRPGSKADVATDVAVSPSGNRVFVVGASSGAGGDPNVQTTIAYNFHGDRLWKAEQNNHGLEPSVEVSSDGGRVFVGNNHTLSAYRTGDGSPLWSTGGSPGSLIAADPQGSQIYAAGILGDCMAVRAFDGMTGDVLWTGSHCFSATSFATAIAVSPQGGHVLITGEDNSDSGGAYYTGSASFDAGNGDLEWFRGFGKCCSSVGDAIAVSSNGSKAFVSAYDSNEWARIAYRTADGKLLWHRAGGGAGLGFALGPPDTANRIFIGSPRFSIGAFDASSGERIWHARYVGPVNSFATAIGIAPNGGRLYLAGWSPTRGNGLDFVVVAFGAANGSMRWVRRYNGLGDGRDLANALAVSPVGGRLYVSGASEGKGTGSDFATVNYRSG